MTFQSAFESSSTGDLIDFEAVLFRRDLVHALGWQILPAASASHFSTDQAKALADAIRQCFGEPELVLYQTDGFPHLPSIIRIAPDADLIFDAGKELAPSNVILEPDGLSFVVFCTVWDYFLIAGPQPFLNSYAKGDFDGELARFREFALSYRSAREQARLLHVLESSV